MTLAFCYDKIAHGDEMEEKIEQAYLYDFYGELLNEHQRRIYEDFVFNDLSLGEIASEEGISRQGVHDMIKRCTKTLEGYEAKLQERDAEIVQLKKQIAENNKEQNDRKVMLAEKYANVASHLVHCLLMGGLFLVNLVLIVVFGVRCWNEYVKGDTWLPYFVVEMLSFIGVPMMLLAKGSPCNKWICRCKDRVYSRLYSFCLTLLENV